MLQNLIKLFTLTSTFHFPLKFPIKGFGLSGVGSEVLLRKFLSLLVASIEFGCVSLVYTNHRQSLQLGVHSYRMKFLEVSSAET
jgi:hypothetical protein